MTCYLQETHLTCNDTHWLKVKGGRNIYQTENTGTAILISDKTDFKPTTIKKDKEGHYIMIKGSIQQDITILNIYEPDTRAPRFIKQELLDLRKDLAI